MVVSIASAVYTLALTDARASSAEASKILASRLQIMHSEGGNEKAVSQVNEMTSEV
jgi:hypothetical protein